MPPYGQPGSNLPSDYPEFGADAYNMPAFRDPLFRSSGVSTYSSFPMYSNHVEFPAPYYQYAVDPSFHQIPGRTFTQTKHNGMGTIESPIVNTGISARGMAVPEFQAQGMHHSPQSLVKALIDYLSTGKVR